MNKKSVKYRLLITLCTKVCKKQTGHYYNLDKVFSEQAAGRQNIFRIRKLSNGLKNAYKGLNVARRVQHFNGWTDRAQKNVGATGYDHTQTVREYYNLCSEFMVSTWEESLHFAPLSPSESIRDSQIRHQRLMIAKLELREGMTVVDIGCGIGGPMRRVVNEAGVRAVGVNNSEYQMEKAKSLNAKAGIDHMVSYLACSFMDMSAVANDTFDRGYAIESTCHAPDKAAAFAEIYRVLKPGALFWGQEMCLTDKFDPDDNRHQTIKQELMHGIALKDIATIGEVNQALETAGFQVVEGADHAVEQNGPAKPWYQPMEKMYGTLGGISLLRTPLGRKVLIGASRLAEILKVFPKGSTEVVRLMDRTAGAYIAGGRTGIFTPLYCFLARKPL